MKRIYVTHSSAFDFQNELYSPLRSSDLNDKYSITLPHEKSDEQFNSKDFLKKCDLVIAEVSYPSTGQGIELGWADSYRDAIICIYKTGTKPSGSLKTISNVFIEYKDKEEMVLKLTEYLKTINSK